MASTDWLADDEDEQQDQEPQGTPLPYVDAEISAELAEEGLPDWFGVRWRDIAIEDQPEAWVWLRRFVDWFTVEFCVERPTVPDCWFRHTDTTAELYAVMCLEQKVWESEAPTVATVIYWQSQLPGIYQRLKECSHKVCGQKHEPVDPQLYLREIDEDAWSEVVGSRRVTERFERPAEGRRYLRAVLESEDGTDLGQSDPVGISAYAADTEPSAELRFSPSPGVLDEQLHIKVTDAEQVAGLRWEVSTDEQQTWTPADEV